MNYEVETDNAIKLMERIEGWFSADEARLLFSATVAACRRIPYGSIVEIGSYHGRSTVVLGSAAKVAASPAPCVSAIDPHEGLLTGIHTPPTWDNFNRNIRDAGLQGTVVGIRKRAAAAPWGEPIAMLMIDGLHDYDNVAADYRKFSAYVPYGGLIAFHDYSNPDYPDVRKFVDERIARGELAVWGLPRNPRPEASLIVTRRLASLSVVIPTIGRASLERTITSLIKNGLRTSDELIVVGEGPQPEAAKICAKFPNYSVTYIESHSQRDHTNRNVAQLMATKTHLHFIDDDDVSVNDAINNIKSEIEEHPDRVLLFKVRSNVERHPWGTIWKEKVIRLGNVGTQSIVVPNVRKWLGHWGDWVTGDYDFIRSTVDRWPGNDAGVVWVDRVVAELR